MTILEVWQVHRALDLRDELAKAAAEASRKKD
jgi:hypothetical protein